MLEQIWYPLNCSHTKIPAPQQTHSRKLNFQALYVVQNCKWRARNSRFLHGKVGHAVQRSNRVKDSTFGWSNIYKLRGSCRYKKVEINVHQARFHAHVHLLIAPLKLLWISLLLKMFKNLNTYWYVIKLRFEQTINLKSNVYVNNVKLEFVIQFDRVM